MNKKFKMHVISGTHWDREWRHTAEQSKLRLTELVDSILDVLESNEDYKCFCLDGGTVVLEDYLTVKPKNIDRIKKLVKSKKLQLVKWYTLPEMSTVAPEALIRNLLKGSHMAEEFGGSIDMGYTATSYGQISQLPQIYKGFGMNSAMFYRGVNKHVLSQLFLWEAPDSTRIYVHKTFDDLTRTNWFFYVHQPLVLGKVPNDVSYKFNRENVPVHMCDDGLYERMFVLLKEEIRYDKSEKAIKAALKFIYEHSRPFAIGNHLLALNLEDNAKPFTLLPDMLKEMNRVSPDIELVQDSLDEYINSIIEENKNVNLPVHKGELRYTKIEHGFWGGLLGATHSSRIKLKILNNEAETALLYCAEPIAAFAGFYGREYPKNYLDRAWDALLKNQSHDSICGAAIDQAHQDMLYGFSIAKTIAEETTARSAAALFVKINTAKDFEKTDHIITMFNTLNAAREEVLPVTIDLPNGEGEYFDVLDNKGNKVEHVLLSSEKIRISVESELDTTVGLEATRKRILIKAKLPQMGYTTYALRNREPKYIPFPETAVNRPLIGRPNGVLENEFLKATIGSNGTFNLLHKESGRIMENLHYFTDEGKIGDAHHDEYPQRNPVYTSIGSPASIVLIETNVLRGVFKIDTMISVPSAATTTDRIGALVVIPVTYWITLYKGDKLVRIKTRIHNKARDHKLCVNFPSKIKTDSVYAESAFMVEKRSIIWSDTADNDEGFYAFQPMQNFIDVNDGKVGLAVMTKGLREYEVMDDEDRTVAITLLRTNRAYMTANKDMTPDELDKYTGQHSFGEMEFRYALCPHLGCWESGKVIEEAYKYKVEIKAIQGVPVEGELDSSAEFITIEPESRVIVSALKQSEDGSGYILRLWNTTSEDVMLNISTILPIKEVKRLKLDESIIGDLKVDSGKFKLNIGAHKIETIFMK